MGNLKGKKNISKTLEKYLRKYAGQKQYSLVILAYKKASQGNKKDSSI